MTRLKPRTTSVLIYQGDDDPILADLRRAVNIAEARAARLLDAAVREAQASNLRDGDDDPVAIARTEAEVEVKAAREAFEAFVPEAAERALEVEVRGLGSRRFRELVAAHPPRKVMRKVGDEEQEVDLEEDAQFGVNVSTFPKALLTYIDTEDTEVRTITAPEFKGSRDIEDFLDDEVSEGDLDRLWIAAFALNRSHGADPKVEMSLLTSRSSTET